MEEKNAVISYKYKRGQNQLANLTKTNTPVSTHKLSNDLKYYNRAIELSHRNYIKYMFYDEKQKAMFHQVYDCTLENYIHRLKSRSKPQNPVLEFTRPSLQESHYYVNPLYRSIVKSMVQFIVDQHINEFSLMEFGMKNIVFVGDVLKFFDVGFRACSKATQKEDFSCLSEIVKTIFDGVETAELKVFLTLMDNLDCERNNSGLVLLHHLAIMSPRESVQFFISSHDRGPCLDRRFSSLYNKAIHNMIMCNYWNKRFNVKNRNVGPVDRCFNQHNDICHRNGTRGYDYICTDINLYPSGSIVKKSLLKCCRNLAVHLRENTPELLFDIDIERMIIYVLGPELLSFQEALGTVGCLSPFVGHH